MSGMKRQLRTKTSSRADHALGPVMTSVVARARGVLHGLEITLDIALAGVLVIAIALIGADTVGLVAEGIHEGGIDAALLILDRVLLVFIIAELLYTLRLSLARTQLILEPFLIIGLVAVVRRVLVVTAQAERILSEGGDLEPILWELGVLAGLVVGKPIGILLAARLATALGAKLSAGMRWIDIALVGALGGIGFTVSLLISELAFANEESLGAAKIGVLIASLAAVALSAVVLALRRSLAR